MGIASTAGLGCAAGKFLRYNLNPKYPEFKQDQTLDLPGLSASATVTQRDSDGMYRIDAANEADMARVVGYLQARDRMFQMDLLRRVARGEVAELLGDQIVGDKSVLDSDRFNRFIGHKQAAEQMLAGMAPDDRLLLDAYTAGVNHWLKTGKVTLEHRLLGVKPVTWRPEDSFALFRLVMFGMTHNYSREVRRLLIACDAGLEALERMWPNTIDFGPTFLPPEAIDGKTYPIAPAIVPEMAANLEDLCPKNKADAPPVARRSAADGKPWPELAGLLQAFQGGLNASNNWVLAADRTASGGVLLANDPHLPHMNPPILWGAHYRLADGNEVAGFTIPGLPLMIFATNGKIAWGETINNVDLQDVYLEYPADHTDAPMAATAYLYDSGTRPFEVRSETFHVKGGKSQTFTARFSHHGPILNDIDPLLAARAPLLALKTVDLADAGDTRAARQLSFAGSVTDALRQLEPMDSACLSWLLGGRDGDIAWTSPCRVPKRNGWFGSFPAPGWLSAYEWDGYYEKNELPVALNPKRGWIATANNQAMPLDRFPSAYVNDAAPANRYSILAAALANARQADVSTTTTLHMNTAQEYWPRVRAEITAEFCPDISESRALAAARAALCAWDGDMASDSVGATVFILVTYGLLDLGLADELSEPADGKLWHYIFDIAHTEANIDWMWLRPLDDPMWDDVRTTTVENKIDTLNAALRDAVVVGTRRYGADIAAWRWGDVRPFVLKHPFGAASPSVAKLFNAPPLPGLGGPETVFKNQFVRADREEMHPAAGPAIRVIYDFGIEDGYWYALAGGQSGWPKSPYYANMLADWRWGRLHKLMVQDDDPGKTIRLVGD